MTHADLQETLEQIQRLGRLVEDALTAEDAASHVRAMAKAVSDVVAAAGTVSEDWRHAADATLALDHAVTLVRERIK